MRKYFIATRQKKLNSIKQLVVHSIVLAARCIGADGDIKNESGRGRLWKGTDEDRLFFHDAFLNKWERHMEKLGYPFTQDMLQKLKIGERCRGLPNQRNVCPKGISHSYHHGSVGSTWKIPYG
jgi:hypothetical protein